jgi:hypothetical protein
VEDQHKGNNSTEAGPDTGAYVRPAAGVKRPIKVLVVVADPIVDVGEDDVLHNDKPERKAGEAHLDRGARHNKCVLEGVVGVIGDGGRSNLGTRRGSAQMCKAWLEYWVNVLSRMCSLV